MEGGAARRPRQETKQLVLDAGVAILTEEGLQAGADVTFKRVFARVEADTGVRLTNASVIRRVWDNQAAFQSELLAAVATDFYARGHIGDATGQLTALLAHVDRSSPGARWASLVECTRLLAARVLATRVDHRDWELFVSVWTVAVTNPHLKADPQLREALTKGMNLTLDEVTGMLAIVNEYLGLRVKEGLTLRDYGDAVSAMALGFGLRQASQDDPQVCHLPTGPNGEVREWTMFAVALEGLAMRYLELVPGWGPPD